MRKFRLIKEYPGSPELGVIKSTDDYFSRFHPFNLDVTCMERYSEFWEELVKKEWEIIAYKYLNNIYKYSYSNKENRIYMWLNGMICSDSVHNLSTAEIYSVKRLSDNQEFKIGDKFNLSGRTGIIKYFKYTENRGILVESEGNPDSRLDISEFKLVKQPLFITEDGKDVYEGDYCYYINNKDLIVRENLLVNKSLQTSQINNKDFGKYFSTKKEAEEYIMENKPCFSIKELRNKLFIEEDELKELVKQKLNL